MKGTTKRLDAITPIFVEMMPDILEAGKLYVSTIYHTAIHKCACGCGEKVVTPINHDGWELNIQENMIVSLTPSIGSFSLPCKSHYLITQNKVLWC
jgi:hypothetical protein